MSRIHGGTRMALEELPDSIGEKAPCQPSVLPRCTLWASRASPRTATGIKETPAGALNRERSASVVDGAGVQFDGRCIAPVRPERRTDDGAACVPGSEAADRIRAAIGGSQARADAL